MAAQRDEDADERREPEHHAVRPRGRDPGRDQHDRDQEPAPRLAAEEDAVGREARVAREDAAHQVLERVAGEQQHQPHEQQRLVVEEVGHQPRRGDQRQADQDRGKDRRADARAPDERSPAEPARGATGERPRDLLLHRQARARTEQEPQRPQRGQAPVALGTERTTRDGEEAVAGDAAEQDPGPDDPRATRQDRGRARVTMRRGPAVVMTRHRTGRSRTRRSSPPTAPGTRERRPGAEHSWANRHLGRDRHGSAVISRA